MTAPRKVLMIARYFPPSSLVGGQRPLKLARRLADFGWEPVVLTTDEACMGPLDPSLIRDVEHVRIERTPCRSPWHHGHWWHLERGLRRLVALACRLFAKLTLARVPHDMSHPWARACVRRGVSLVRELEIDLIWVTAPPESALEAARGISQQTGVPYVVDFRDVKMNYTGQADNHRRIQAVLDGAAGITYVSPAHPAQLDHNFPSSVKTPRALIYNWFEPEERRPLPAEMPSERTILHGGNLYGGKRNTGPFLEALARFNQAHPDAPCRFLQYGRHNADHLTAQAARLEIADHVSVCAPLNRPAFLDACAHGTILLLVVGHDHGDAQHAGAVPGKLFDYFLTGRPILVIGPRDCTAGRMVTQCRRGLHVADDDTDGILAALETLCGDHDLDLSPEGVAAYAAPEMVGRTAAFFDRLVPRTQAEPADDEEPT